MKNIGNYQAIILCEDHSHYRFLREFLIGMGISHRRILPPRMAPIGRGSAEQWVLEQFPGELRSFRSRSTRTLLLVAIDADTSSVAERHESLLQELAKTGEPPLQTNEAVAFIIPKRNIETWFHFLLTSEINEDKSYRIYYRKSISHKDLIQQLTTTFCQTPHKSAPPSLQTAQMAWKQVSLTISTS